MSASRQAQLLSSTSATDSSNSNASSTVRDNNQLSNQTIFPLLPKVHVLVASSPQHTPADQQSSPTNQTTLTYAQAASLPIQSIQAPGTTSAQAALATQSQSCISATTQLKISPRDKPPRAIQPPPYRRRCSTYVKWSLFRRGVHPSSKVSKVRRYGVRHRQFMRDKNCCLSTRRLVADCTGALDVVDVRSVNDTRKIREESGEGSDSGFDGGFEDCHDADNGAGSEELIEDMIAAAEDGWESDWEDGWDEAWDVEQDDGISGAEDTEHEE